MSSECICPSWVYRCEHFRHNVLWLLTRTIAIEVWRFTTVHGTWPDDPEDTLPSHYDFAVCLDWDLTGDIELFETMEEALQELEKTTVSIEKFYAVQDAMCLLKRQQS